MPYIATINSNSPQALNLVNYLKTFEFIDVIEQKKATKNKSQTALAQPDTARAIKQRKKFEKMLMRGLKDVKAHREGTKEFQSVEDFLNEL